MATENARPTLVVARYKEDLSWLGKVPIEYDIIVYNKSNVPLIAPPSRRISIKSLSNKGKEADTYCNFILEHYHNLPNTIVFCQGDPFPHSPDFLTLLSQHECWTGFQSLTIRYVEGIPPKEIIDKFAIDSTYVERMSCYSLGSIRFHDKGVSHLCDAYLKAYGLPRGTNIIKHHLDSIGLSHLAQDDTEVIDFTYSAIFAVKACDILEHALPVYERMIKRLEHPDWFEPSISERIWMTLFSKPLSIDNNIDE